jgi:hypothetical protein
MDAGDAAKAQVLVHVSPTANHEPFRRSFPSPTGGRVTTLGAIPTQIGMRLENVRLFRSRWMSSLDLTLRLLATG